MRQLDTVEAEEVHIYASEHTLDQVEGSVPVDVPPFDEQIGRLVNSFERLKSAQSLALTCVVLGLVLGPLLWVAYGSGSVDLSPAIVAGGVLAAVPTALLLPNLLPWGRLRRLVREIDGLTDPHALPAVIDTMGHVLPPTVTRAQHAALARLTPLVPRRIAWRFTADHHGYFNAMLNRYWTIPTGQRADGVLSAILTLLKHVGDERELENLRRVAEVPPRTPTMAEIHALAVECLAELESRFGNVLNEQTLLRASGAGVDDATLLRVAAGTGSEDEATLLRAASTEEPSP